MFRKKFRRNYGETYNMTVSLVDRRLNTLQYHSNNKYCKVIYNSDAVIQDIISDLVEIAKIIYDIQYFQDNNTQTCKGFMQDHAIALSAVSFVLVIFSPLILQAGLANNSKSQIEVAIGMLTTLLAIVVCFICSIACKTKKEKLIHKKNELTKIIKNNKTPYTQTIVSFWLDFKRNVEFDEEKNDNHVGQNDYVDQKIALSHISFR